MKVSELKVMFLGPNGRVRRELRRLFVDPIGQVRKNPHNVGAWVDLIERERAAGRLSPHATALATSHHLSRRGVVGGYLDEIAGHAAGPLRVAASDPLQNLPRVVDEIVRWKTIIQCRDTHAGDAPYFPFAEANNRMGWQWDDIIWPIINGSDFTTVLELACGHGRNTELLRRHTKTIHLVDVNQSCLDACRARFGERKDECRFFYHLTDGTFLPGVDDGSITFAYSWDSMVHFDKLVIRGYIHEFARVLKPGGRAFCHMSNYGSIRPDSDFVSNFGGRSDMSIDLLRQYTAEAGLSVRFVREMIGWDRGGSEPLDLLCLIEKPW